VASRKRVGTERRGHGLPPVPHRAAGIHLGDRRERLGGRVKPEGVEHRDGPVKFLLGSRRARDGEVDLANPLLRRRLGAADQSIKVTPRRNFVAFIGHLPCHGLARAETGSHSPRTSPEHPVRPDQHRLRDREPRLLAVFRMRSRSNLAGYSTGRSAGLAPLRILSRRPRHGGSSRRGGSIAMRPPASTNSRSSYLAGSLLARRRSSHSHASRSGFGAALPQMSQTRPRQVCGVAYAGSDLRRRRSRLDRPCCRCHGVRAVTSREKTSSAWRAGGITLPRKSRTRGEEGYGRVGEANGRRSTTRISSKPTLKNFFTSTGSASVPASHPASAAGLFRTSSGGLP